MLLKLLLVAALCLVNIGASSNERISGGLSVNAADGFWMASFQTKTSSTGYPEHKCGASILSPDWVVTLASCVVNASLSTHQVYTNAIHAYYEGDKHEIEYWVSHPDFDPTTMKNNIAVVKLLKPIYISNDAMPINLPGQDYDPMPGLEMTLYGWGARNEGETFYPLMYKARGIMVIDKDVCNATYGGRIHEDNFCATSSIVGEGACDHEEGSSLVVQGLLQGMVSWGQGCGDPAFPYVYTRLGAFRIWINEVTEV